MCLILVKMKSEIGIIYITPKKKVLRKLEEVDTMIFDLDDTLIKFPQGYLNLNSTFTWQVMQTTVGLNKNPKFIELFTEYNELAKFPDKEKERKEIAKQLNSFWKGYKLKDVSKNLFPIPYLSHVKSFFEKIHNAKKKFFLAIISSAPHFYIKSVVNELRINYFEGFELEINSERIFTGKMKYYADLYGKRKSLEKFCKTYSRNIEKTIYHGDHHIYDRAALNYAGLSVAVNPKEEHRSEFIDVADFILYDWSEHPLLEILNKK